MALSLNKPKLDNLASDIWKSAERLRGKFKSYEYQSFSEQSGDEAGEHFTPREVVRLMVELLDIPIPDKHLSIYDPASGTGGMLSVAKEHLLERAVTKKKTHNFPLALPGLLPQRGFIHQPRVGPSAGLPWVTMTPSTNPTGVVSDKTSSLADVVRVEMEGEK